MGEMFCVYYDAILQLTCRLDIPMPVNDSLEVEEEIYMLKFVRNLYILKLFLSYV